MGIVKHFRLLLLLSLGLISNVINGQDDCGTAIDVNAALGPFGFCETYVGIFTTAGLSPEPDLAWLNCEYENNPTAWLVIDPPPGATDMTIVIQGISLPDPTLGIFLENGCLPPYNQAGPFSGCNFNPAEYTVLVNNVNLYYIVVSSQSGSGNFSIEITFGGGTPTPANDFCANAVVLLDGVQLINESNECATSDNTGDCPMDDATVWYEIDVPADFSLDVTLTPGSIVSPSVAIYDACGGSQIDVGNCNNIASTTCLPAGTYFIEVASTNGNEGDFDIIAELTSCATPCSIDAANLGNIGCSPNIPNDGNIFDDIITFTLNPTGSGLSSGYLITTSSGLVLPTSANYGSPTIFSMQDGSAGSGNFTITITDANDPTCFIDVLVIDPGHCSNECMISDEGLDYVDCDNNGTPSDPSDDIILFGLNPTGQDLGSDYFISASTGNVAPMTANYGVVTDFMLDPATAGGGDVIITITDNDFLNCEYSFTLTDPGSCSNECQIDILNLSNISCDNNGTADATDDFITFELNPIGTNLDVQYTVQSSIGSVTPQLAVYGGSQSFALDIGSASIGDVIITIVDQADFNCFLDTVLINPGPCSNAEIVNETAFDINCNDNSTVLPADDYITFSLNPSLINGLTYTIDISTGTVIPTTANYDEVTSFRLEAGSAGGGDKIVTITDALDNSIIATTIIIDPGSCANNCHIDSMMIVNMVCHDNDTPFEDEDDYLVIDLLSCDSSLMDSIILKIIDLDTICSTFSSKDTITIMTSEGSANLDSFIIVVIDQLDSTNVDTISVYPSGTCSPECLIAGQSSYIGCQNNNTSITTDDTLLFLVNLTIFNGNTNFFDYDLPGLAISGQGEWGQDLILSIPTALVGTNDFQIFIQSQGDTICSELITIINPGPCSDECSINSPIISNTSCNNNGTPSINTDDFIQFSMLVTGTGVGARFEINSPSSLITPSNNLYNISDQYNLEIGSAGAGDLVITLIDEADTFCVQTAIILDPGDCSTACEINDYQLLNIECHNNGTPIDRTDDYLTFDLSVNGLNTSTNFNLDGGSISITPMIGTYGVISNYRLQSGSAGNGDLVVDIIDGSNSQCNLSVDIEDPGNCSMACEITFAIIDQIECNNNGTPLDSLDDFVTFNMMVEGDNVGPRYLVDLGATPITPANGLYSVTSFFTLGAGTVGNGNLTGTVTDEVDSSCSFNIEIIDPGKCYLDCDYFVDVPDSIVLDCNQPNAIMNGVFDGNGISSWENQSGQTISMSDEVLLNSEGIYYFIVDYNDGCIIYDSIVVTEDFQYPFFELGNDTIINCRNNGIELTAPILESDFLYAWTIDEDVVSNDIDFLFIDSGKVKLTITNASNGCSISDSLEITLDTISPSAIIYANPDLVIDCVITSIQLTGEGENDVIYTWSFSDNIVTQNIFVVNGSGIVELIAIDTINGCENIGLIEIENNQEYPIIDLIGDTLFCAEDSIIIDGTGSQSGSSILVEWSNVEGQTYTETGYTLQINQAGSYILSLEDESNGCQNADTINIIDISIPFDPYQIDQTTLADGNILLALNSSDLLVANWYIDGELVCLGCKELNISGLNMALVTVEILDQNGCVERVILTIEPESGIYMPNVFSPNGDNVNDLFIIKGHEGTLINRFSIFDRWGNKMFNLNNQFIGDGIEWDGKSNGRIVSQGVYVYVLNYLDKVTYGEILVIR